MPRAGAVARLLGTVADEVDALVVEVKRIVRDLRPTALDQLGLVGAVGEFTRTFGDELEFHVEHAAAPVESAGGGRGRDVPNRHRGA